MKTLIFSIYISTHGVYQWEVRMFLNSLLTWSLGRATHKCCVAGVKIGDRGILRAVRSWLQHHAQLARGMSWVICTLTPGLFADYCLGIASIPNIPPKWTASVLFSTLPLLSSYPRHTPNSWRKTPHAFTLEPVIPLKESRAILNNTSQAVEQRAGLI